jgi:hypothetical protein
MQTVRVVAARELAFSAPRRGRQRSRTLELQELLSPTLAMMGPRVRAWSRSNDFDVTTQKVLSSALREGQESRALRVYEKRTQGTLLALRAVANAKLKPGAARSWLAHDGEQTRSYH